MSTDAIIDSLISDLDQIDLNSNQEKNNSSNLIDKNASLAHNNLLGITELNVVKSKENEMEEGVSLEKAESHSSYVSIDFNNEETETQPKSRFSFFSKNKSKSDTSPSKNSPQIKLEPSVNLSPIPTAVTRVRSRSNSASGTDSYSKSPTKSTNMDRAGSEPVRNLTMSPLPNSSSSPISIPRRSSQSKHSLDDPSNSPNSQSKTRLAGLPPKDPKEEKKHLAQFQAMMVEAQRIQNSKIQAQIKEKQERERELHKLTTMWSKAIVPNWNQKVWRKKALDHLTQGVPAASRGKVWQLCLEEGKLELKGQATKLDANTYNFLVTRFDDPPEAYKEVMQRNKVAVELDVRTTFPELKLFQPGDEKGIGTGPFHDTLVNIVKAYAAMSPAETYVRRVGHLAAMLVINMDETDAFLNLMKLLTRPTLKAFVEVNSKVNAYIDAFDIMFSENLPRLYVHFQQAQLRSEMFLTQWISNLFIKQLPLEVSSQLWDYYLIGMPHTDTLLLEIAVVLLTYLEPHLYSKFEETLHYLSDPVDLDITYFNQHLNFYKYGDVPNRNDSHLTKKEKWKVKVPKDSADILERLTKE